MSPVALLFALASLSPADTAAAVPPQSTPAQTATPVPQEEIDADAYDLGTLEVVTTARRGAALGDYEPELTLDEEQIKAYGASSIEELMTLLEPVTRSSRGGSPVFLVNGRRISGFREIRGIPPEAIERTEILPEETALSYGYSADQRVVNFVLKADFRSVTMQATARRPDQGGRTMTDLESNVLRISGKQRWTLDLEYERDTPLFETERNIVRDGTPYDLMGNVTSPGGGEIDPALSALLGQSVTTASVGAGAAGGAALSDFGVGPRTDDLTAYRTLSPKRENSSISGSLVRDLNQTMSLTLSGELEDTSSFSYLGLPGLSLALPSASPYSPFASDVLLHRYVDAPGAHVEAPTGGSVVLAAIMLKLGGYGFLRLSMPIAPDASHELTWFMVALSLVAIVYIGLVALVQADMKKLIAYSSISHMGFVTLGMFVFNAQGMEGAIIQMISHGFISGAMFLCVGVLYDRLHSRQISDYGGVVNRMPVFAALFMLFAMANAGLPGTSGFVGEFMVIMGSIKVSFWYAFAAATTLIFGAAYTLWMYKRVIFGAVANEKVAHLQDINLREFVVLGLLAVAVLWMGIHPAPFADVLHVSVDELLGHVSQTKIPAP